MYYKLYIDSVFILQAAMNLYLLSLAGQILRCTATHQRRWLGALAGAGLSCIMLSLPISTAGARLLVSAVPVSMWMMCLTYRIHGVRRLFGASLAMAAAGFFSGGAMIWILNRLRPVMRGRGSLLLTLAAGALVYWILRALLKKLMRRERECLRTVRLYVPALKQEIRLKALVDTGNHLTDPISGAPVCVVSRRAAGSLASCLQPEKYHAVPYRSVGQPAGILPAYELPEISIEEAGRTIKREGVIVAVCDAGISPESDYQMLLHPGLLEN
ncbi:MAG: sigma-E processing peptidase SpoIIGA [Bacteroidales bacterium]|nr:sigma-E processing peptidase SpoIIGA [Bacteroidales bacterium]MCM1416307.1 sigma-E processing peptidase SpoIIGA [bacterium]MCM1424243.1 sigma-E processing peptidase SpoIIGA [bacterium]